MQEFSCLAAMPSPSQTGIFPLHKNVGNYQSWLEEDIHGYFLFFRQQKPTQMLISLPNDSVKFYGKPFLDRCKELHITAHGGEAVEFP